MGQRSQLYFVVSSIAALGGVGACAPAAEAPPADLTAVEDSVLALEQSMNDSVDDLECSTTLGTQSDLEPAFVGNGMVIRTAAEFVDLCDMLMADRTGSEWANTTITANALSDDAVYVVREGEYTVHYTDRESETMPLVMTSIWQSGDSGWQLVHLHESWPAIPE